MDDIPAVDGFEVSFLPANTTSFIQPMDQGVTEKIMRCFRKDILRRVLNFAGGTAEFMADYDLKDCVDLLHAARMDISQSNIQDS